MYESAQPRFPSPSRVNSHGAWSCLLAIVEALYLCGFRDEAAALSPLVDRALEEGPDWLSFDGRLVETRAGVAATAAGCWEAAERHYSTAQQHAQRMNNPLEETELRYLRARMLIDRNGGDDRSQAAELLQQALLDYRRFGMPSYSAEMERMLLVTRG